MRRESSAPRSIAITGSAGKTTTKETIAALLEAVTASPRTRAISTTISGFRSRCSSCGDGADVAVMELGMNHAGEMRLLVGIAEPEIRVWTNVGDAHLGYFASRAALADAKAEILENASAADVSSSTPTIRWSWRAQQASRDARLRLERRRTRMSAPTPSRISGSTACASVSTPPTRRRMRRVPLLGRGNLMNVLAATAVALELGVPLDEIVRRAASLSPAPHRGAVARLARGVTVVRRLLQLQPHCARARARGAGARTPRDAKGCGARRDAGARRARGGASRARAAAPRLPHGSIA